MSWLVALTLLADPGAHATWVELNTTPDCPGRDAFVQELGERTPLVRVVDDPAAASARVTVRITRRGNRFEGRLLVEIDGVRTARVLEGSRCQSLTSALTLSAALLFDPEAKLVVTKAPEPGPVIEPGPVVEPGPKVEPAPRVEPAPITVAPEPTVAPQPLPSRLRWELRAGGWASSGVSGLVDFGGGGRAGLAVRLGDESAWSVITQLGAAAIGGRTVESDAGRARYATRLVTELDGGLEFTLAALRVQLTGLVQLAPLFVEGLDGDETLRSQRFLWALGPALRAGVVWSGWELSARVSPLFALRLERYVIEPRGVVFSVPAVSMCAAIELGRAF